MHFAQCVRAPARGFAATSVACAVSLVLMSAAAQAAEDESLAEVQITGSRIQQTSGFETPTPVTTVTSEELDKLEPGQIIDSLADLPVFFNTQRPQTTGFPSSAGSNLDLRGAGPTRTLVLLDGRRIPKRQSLRHGERRFAAGRRHPQRRDRHRRRFRRVRQRCCRGRREFHPRQELHRPQGARAERPDVAQRRREPRDRRVVRHEPGHAWSSAAVG